MRIDHVARNLVLASIIIHAAVAGPLAAEEDGHSWQPPPPMPDDFDWIQFTSGEWLKGEIIAMYEESLEFDSDQLDELTLDWEDIQEVRSAQTVQVAFDDKVIATGRLLVEGDAVRVMGEQEYSAARSRILSITAGEPKERNFWSGKLSAGFDYRTGNTERTELNSMVGFMRRTPKNRINVDFLGAFSESNNETIADNQNASVVWNRFISQRFFVTPVTGEYYRDPFLNIAGRWTLGAGAGYQIIDTPKIGWDISVSIAYQRTDFDSVALGESDSADTPAFAVSTRYDNELTAWMDYNFAYRSFIVNEESGTYIHHLATGFEFELIGDLDFDVTFIWDRIQDPRQNSDGSVPEQDEFRTIFGLGYSF